MKYFFNEDKLNRLLTSYAEATPEERPKVIEDSQKGKFNIVFRKYSKGVKLKRMIDDKFGSVLKSTLVKTTADTYKLKVEAKDSSTMKDGDVLTTIVGVLLSLL